MKVFALLLLFASAVLGRDLATLDGRSFSDCTISRVYPDSLCVLFSGGGARVYFTNLSEAVRAEFSYDRQRAEEFAKSEAARVERERNFIEAQRVQLAAQQRAASSNVLKVVNASTNRAPFFDYGGAPTGAGGGIAGAYNANFGSQNGGRFGGAQYVGVRMVWPGGGVRGIVETPTRARPWSTNSPYLP